MDTESLHGQLASQGYTLHAQFTFREMLEPVREGLQTRNGFRNGFILIIFFFMLITTASVASSLVLKQLSFNGVVYRLFLGVVFTFVLIPLHEWLHGLAFRYYGARDVRYGVVWRYLMFYAVSHLQVLGARQYYRIGLAPFVVITLGGLITYFFCGPALQLTILSLLSFHTLCCAGDFGLCAYFLKYIDSEPLTFDDAGTGTTYIYLKKYSES